MLVQYLSLRGRITGAGANDDAIVVVAMVGWHSKSTGLLLVLVPIQCEIKGNYSCVTSSNPTHKKNSGSNKNSNGDKIKVHYVRSSDKL